MPTQKKWKRELTLQSARRRTPKARTARNTKLCTARAIERAERQITIDAMRTPEWHVAYDEAKRYQRWLYMQRWLKKNRRKHAKVLRAWATKNRERRRAYILSRLYEHKKGAEGHFTYDDVIAQLKLQRGRCFWCPVHVSADYHIDHYFPINRGGSNWPHNLKIACEACNKSKANMLPQEFIEYRIMIRMPVKKTAANYVITHPVIDALPRKSRKTTN